MKTIFYTIILTFVITLSSFKNEKPEQSNTSKSISIVGNVVDKQNGEALAGVKVTLDGTNLTTYTDFDGNFEFDNVSRNEDYSLSSELISYKTGKYKQERTENKTDTNSIKIELEHVN